MSNLAEMGAVAEFQGLDDLGKRKKAQKCQSGYRRVKHPQQGFVCIPKKPCATGYRFNAKQFACVPKKKAKRPGAGGFAPIPNFDVSQVPGGFDDAGTFPGGTFDPSTGFPGGIPGDIFAPGAPGLPSMACAAGLVQDPYTGQCVQAGTNQPQGPQGPQGPSALYPFGGGGFQQPSFGGGGGFQQPSFGGGGGYSGGGGGASFDNVPGADVDSGGSEDFIPEDVQMNLTPPGMPQDQGQFNQFSVDMSEQQGPQEIFGSGGTDEAAYEGMMGLGVDATPTDIASQIERYRDIGLQTAEKIKLLGKKEPKPERSFFVLPDSNTWQTPVALGVGALLIYGIVRAMRK